MKMSENLDESESTTIEIRNIVPQKWPGSLVGEKPPRGVLSYLAKKSEMAINISRFPDVIADRLTTSMGTALFTSIRGDMKRNNGEPRQDYGAIHSKMLMNAEVVFLVMSDGVGTKPLSHFAAIRIVDSAMSFLDEIDSFESTEWEEKSKNLVTYVCENVENLAKSMQINSSELLATLRISVLVPTESEFVRVFSLAVGNGVHAIVDGEITRKFCITDEETNEGIFVPVSKALPIHADSLVSEVFEVLNSESIVMLTDGAQEVINQGIKFTDLVNSEDLDHHKLSWALDVRSAGASDDRSAIIWKPSYAVK